MNPVTGSVETPLLTGLASTHGLDFVAAPEPSTGALLLLGIGGVATAGTYRRKSGAGSRLAAAS